MPLQEIFFQTLRQIDLQVAVLSAHLLSDFARCNLASLRPAHQQFRATLQDVTLQNYRKDLQQKYKSLSDINMSMYM